MKEVVIAIIPYFSKVYGRDGGARTRDRWRDSKAETRNSLKPGATDGYCKRPGAPWEPIIEPLSHPRPLSTRPLS
jgi:hypothetical protein